MKTHEWFYTMFLTRIIGESLRLIYSLGRIPVGWVNKVEKYFQVKAVTE